MRPLRSALWLAVPLLLAGCLEAVSPVPERVAFFNVTSASDNGIPKVRVDGAIFRGFGLDISLGTPETCQVLPFNPATGTAGALTISGGLSVNAQIAGGAASVPQVTTSIVIRYEMAPGSELPYTPGDTLTLTIPGDPEGFPASSARIRTSEAFSVSPIVPPATGQPLNLTWSTPTVTGSLITLSLRYSNNSSSSVPDVEVYCVFNDDGSASVPANFAGAWSAASENARSYLMARVREAGTTVSARTRIRLFSFHFVPTPEVDAGPTLR